jgi:hypothetical protein
VHLLVESVGAHHGGAHDAFRNLRQQLPHPRAHNIVGREQALLQHSKHEDQRRHDDDHDRGEPRRVHQHDDERAGNEGGAREPRERGPFHELGKRVDVRRDARHERPALVFILLGQAQAVNVLEGLHAQTLECGLRSAHHARERRPCGEVSKTDCPCRSGACGIDELGAEPLSGAQTLVEDLLYQDRNQKGACRTGDRKPYGVERAHT